MINSRTSAPPRPLSVAGPADRSRERCSSRSIKACCCSICRWTERISCPRRTSAGGLAGCTPQIRNAPRRRPDAPRNARPEPAVCQRPGGPLPGEPTEGTNSERHYCRTRRQQEEIALTGGGLEQIVESVEIRGVEVEVEGPVEVHGHDGVADTEQAQGKKERPYRQRGPEQDPFPPAGRQGQWQQQEPDVHGWQQQAPGKKAVSRICNVQQDTEYAGGCEKDQQRRPGADAQFHGGDGRRRARRSRLRARKVKAPASTCRCRVRAHAARPGGGGPLFPASSCSTPAMRAWRNTTSSPE